MEQTRRNFFMMALVDVVPLHAPYMKPSGRRIVWSHALQSAAFVPRTLQYEWVSSPSHASNVLV
eukprot:4580396-Amphidinium_carterae.1